MFDINHIEGFEWDDGNREKNWLKHGVSTSECEEVFFNVPLLIKDDISHSQNEVRYFALGKSNLGKYLFISFTLRDKLIRIISAREMTKKERGIYQIYT